MPSLIPYGVSNFSLLRGDGSLFVDHTGYLRLLENSPRVLLLLRPRRFGKSLWISILEHYYDLRFADRFQELFGDLEIGREPTPEWGRFLVMVLDFSVIQAQGSTQEVGASFLESIRQQGLRFLDQHQTYLSTPENARQTILNAETATEAFTALANLAGASGHPLYLLVDEYDNFTNELVATGRERTYEELVRGSGPVRTFFKAVKEATRSGALSRCFLTGVNPLLLNDLTSGFNIAMDLSLRAEFADLMGFTRDEVASLLREVSPAGTDQGAMLSLMEDWYDGYHFHVSGSALFNPDMVLYFLWNLTRGAVPEDPLDKNLRTDIHKLGLVVRNPARDAILYDLCASGEIVGSPIDQFDVDGLLDPQNLPSLLFWLGMLSLGTEPGTMRIPNYAVARQYWEETLKLVGRDAGVASVGPIRETLRAMMRDGQGEPFFRLAVDLVLSKLSNRDLLRWGEASVKAILLSFLSLTIDVSVFSEWETNRGYADLVLIPSPHATWLKHAWMIELKVLKKGQDSPGAREQALAEGQEQLLRYLADTNRMRHLSRFKLHHAVAVFVGAEDLVWWEGGS